MSISLKILFGVSLIMTGLLTSSIAMNNAYAVETTSINCKELKSLAFKCSGKQPMVGDFISYETLQGFTITGQVTDVQDFDSPNDRKGQMTVDFGGTIGTISGEVLVVGKL